MSDQLKVAIIGLDTSHSIAFSELLQSPELSSVAKVVSCYRFPTPFYNEEGQDERQKQMEAMGIPVTRNFDKAIADCDAIMLEINDPSYHLEYFRMCAKLGKPLFLDKPMADNKEDGQAILKMAKENNTKVMSNSPLRFVPELEKACKAIPKPDCVTVYGPLSSAPAGSGIVWYGVHAFEMVQRAMGRGAKSIKVVEDAQGITAIVNYADGRRGVVELVQDAYIYGGSIRDKENAAHYTVDLSTMYRADLDQILKFFSGEKVPLELEDAFEVMCMLDATDRAFKSGKEEAL